MDKFQDYYRIPSARANWRNYDAPGIYFITICSAYQECIFGSILNDEVILTESGIIVLQEWAKSFEIRSELFCESFVIMPNHIHAVLRIIKNSDVSSVALVETHGRASLQIEKTDSPMKYEVAYRQPKSISSFVAGFKSVATKLINEFRKTSGMKVWQTRFHDHIIRNEVEYLKIIRYIESNPKNWKGDKYYK
jgi:putative transposase